MRQIKDYSDYLVTVDGKIFSLKSMRFLSQNNKTKAGYPRVQMFNEYGFKWQTIHRLVAETYLPNPENKAQVNHMDGNKANNMLCNLEWMTQSENIQHSFDIGLRPISEAVRESGRIAARDFGAKNGFVFKKIVLDTETGVFYKGVQAAADTIGVTKKHLYRKLNGELKNTTKFKYV